MTPIELLRKEKQGLPNEPYIRNMLFYWLVDEKGIQQSEALLAIRAFFAEQAQPVIKKIGHAKRPGGKK